MLATHSRIMKPAEIDIPAETVRWCESCNRHAAFTVHVEASYLIDGLPCDTRSGFSICWDCLPLEIKWSAAKRREQS